jgi:hypothetical protein
LSKKDLEKRADLEKQFRSSATVACLKFDPATPSSSQSLISAVTEMNNNLLPAVFRGPDFDYEKKEFWRTNIRAQALSNVVGPILLGIYDRNLSQTSIREYCHKLLIAAGRSLPRVSDRPTAKLIQIPVSETGESGAQTSAATVKK